MYPNVVTSLISMADSKTESRHKRLHQNYIVMLFPTAHHRVMRLQAVGFSFNLTWLCERQQRPKPLQEQFYHSIYSTHTTVKSPPCSRDHISQLMHTISY